MKRTITRQLNTNVNQKAKLAIKSAMLETYSQHAKKARSPRKFGVKQRLLLGGASTVFLAVMVLSAISFRTTPLTPDRIIANAVSALDEQASAGDWQLVKTKETLTYDDNRTVTTYTEAWSSGARLDSSKTMVGFSNKTTLEDGRILSETVSVDGKTYVRDTSKISEEIFGYNPNDPSIFQSILPPGFKEAGLTNESFATLSMKEIDDALIAAGQKPFTANQYKSTNFPAYTMKPSELEALNKRYDELTKEDPEYFEKLYGGKGNFAINESEMSVVTTDGTTLKGLEAEAYMKDAENSFNMVNSIRGGSLSERKAALEQLKGAKSISIDTKSLFNGEAAIKLNLSNIGGVQNPGGFQQFTYLDPKTFRMIGEEFFVDTSSDIYARMPAVMRPAKYTKIEYLEQWSTNITPAFSTEGLVPIEALYPSPLGG